MQLVEVARVDRDLARRPGRAKIPALIMLPVPSTVALSLVKTPEARVAAAGGRTLVASVRQHRPFASVVLVPRVERPALTIGEQHVLGVEQGHRHIRPTGC